MASQPNELLEELLRHLGFEAKVNQQKLDDGILLDIQTEDSGRLIGRQGQTLADLQYITNRLLFQKDQNCPKVLVDVAGYRAEAREALIEKARKAAEKVRQFGDIVELEPLSAFDRRIVHNTLKDDPDIETHSVEVEGTDKKVILLRPKKGFVESTWIAFLRASFNQAFRHPYQANGLKPFRYQVSINLTPLGIGIGL